MPDDNYGTSAGGISAPFVRAFTITPHATNELTRVTRGVTATVAGNIACRFANDGADVTVPVLAGVVYPYRLTHVRVAGTTATGIVGLD